MEQDTPLVVAWRRGEHGFAREVYSGLAAVIPLPEIGCALRLGDVYDGADTPPA